MEREKNRKEKNVTNCIAAPIAKTNLKKNTHTQKKTNTNQQSRVVLCVYTSIHVCRCICMYVSMYMWYV